MAMRIYRQLVKDSYTELADGTVTASNVLTRLLRLSQLTGGFLGTDDDPSPEQVSNAKLEALSDIVDSSMESDRKLVVIARFIPEIKAICQMLGLKSLLILPHGLNGDHTDGHIDNVARFIAKDKVVMAWDKGMKSKNAQVLSEAMYLIETWLKAFYAKNAVVETLPLPPQRKLSDGQILPASYMNFIFVNGGLIYPKYKCKNDAVAQKFFEKAFPDRIVIGIDSRTVIEEGGSLHCMSKHESR
jgi:hypothetical protein